MERTPFLVDLTDPMDIRIKHAEAESILSDFEAKLADVRKMEQLVDEWRRNVAFLASKLPDEEVPIQPRSGVAGAPRDKRRISVAELVVEVVNREVRPIRAIDIFRTLSAEGHDVTPSFVPTLCTTRRTKPRKSSQLGNVACTRR
jgi:hypothetical protein